MEDDFHGMELGPRMRACSDRERKFVWFLLTTADGNATEAARLAGYSDPGQHQITKTGDRNPTIRIQAHRMMHNERVLAAIEEVGRKEFRALMVPAILANKRLLKDMKHKDHAKAVMSTLSRVGFAERSGVDVNVTGEVTLNHTDAALEQLRALRDLGVPQEKLVEIFGYSGLTRYERMLEESDRRGPRERAEDERRRSPPMKLIEGTVVVEVTDVSQKTFGVKD